MRRAFWIFLAFWSVFLNVQNPRGPVATAECPPLSTTPSHLTYADSWLLLWDPANPVIIDPGQAVTLRVIGGFAPYQWQLAGEGFHLAESTTQRRSNGVYADAGTCGTAAITVSDHFGRFTGGYVRVLGPDFAWDFENSPAEFPAGDPAVGVFVTGGLPPYEWSVSEGFALGCRRDCGPQNRLSVSDDRFCVAEITVTDACGTEVQGFVRRQGYWQKCFTHKGTLCYVSKQCGNSPELDFGAHRVKVICCKHGASALSATCNADNWQYTAVGDDCTIDNPCEVPLVWALYIWYWVCY